MLAAAFAPLNTTTGLANSVTIAATNASATTGTLPTARSGTNCLRVSNLTSAWAYLNIGTSTLTAATVANSMPVAPGAVEVFTIDASATTVSCILAAGGASGSVTLTVGEGV
jgi:hypothetical protein